MSMWAALLNSAQRQLRMGTARVPSPLAGEGQGEGTSGERSTLTPTLSRQGRGGKTKTTPNVARGVSLLAILALGLFGFNEVFAAGLPALTVQGTGQGQSYSLTLQVLLLMTAITFLPAILLMMTSFTRIIIVLGLLRQAIGAGNSPPNQVLVGLSLFLTLFVMGPVVEKVNSDAVQPYLAGTIDGTAAMEKGIAPLRQFMMKQTREADIATFARIAGEKAYNSADDVPLRILVPSFATSELKSAFQIGFMIFIPFVIIDLVVASVLMSMGMMMLSPMIISLPFKIMLFVLVDGWTLVVSTLASSFYT